MLGLRLVLELAKEFTNIWMALNVYDKNSLNSSSLIKKTIKFFSQELINLINSFCAELVEKKTAAKFFVQEGTVKYFNFFPGLLLTLS